MSSTKTHDTVSLALSATIVVTGLAAHITPQCWLVGLGALLGVLISPDWDWDGTLVEHRDTKRRYVLLERGPRSNERFVRRIYGVVARRWIPPISWWIFVYARLFKHRRISHHFVFGTFSRLAWLVFPLFLTFYFPDVLWVWFGLWVSDLLHLAFDFLL